MHVYAILALILLGVVSGVSAYVNGSINFDAAKETNAGTAIKVQDAMTRVKDAFNMMAFDGFAASTILFNGAPQYAGSTSDPAGLLTSGDPNYRYQLFHPTVGKLTPAPVAPSEASVSTTANLQNFLYRANWRVQTGDATPVDLSTSADDIVMVYPDVKSGVCLAFDARANGTDTNADVDTVIPSTGTTLATLVGTTAGTAVKVSASGAPIRLSGCVRTTDSHYVLFQVIRAR